MTTESQSRLIDETYRALGHYVVAFAGLMHGLDRATWYLLTFGSGGKDSMMLEAVLAGREARQIIEAFFAVYCLCWEGKLTRQDETILNQLRTELADAPKTRNRMMHDAWLYQMGGGDPVPQPLVLFRVQTHRSGANFVSDEQSPGQIEKLAADLERLSKAVNAIVFYRPPDQTGPKLDTRINIVDNKICLAGA